MQPWQLFAFALPLAPLGALGCEAHSAPAALAAPPTSNAPPTSETATPRGDAKAPPGAAPRRPEDVRRDASPRPEDGAREVRFVGVIRDLDLGCWADRECAVQVDKDWIPLPRRGLRGAPEPLEPAGEFVGIALAGAPESELRARYITKRAEVYGRRVPQERQERAARGEGAISLEGSASYFVRMR